MPAERLRCSLLQGFFTPCELLIVKELGSQLKRHPEVGSCMVPVAAIRIPSLAKPKRSCWTVGWENGDVPLRRGRSGSVVLPGGTSARPVPLPTAAPLPALPGGGCSSSRPAGPRTGSRTDLSLRKGYSHRPSSVYCPFPSPSDTESFL